MGVRIHSNTMSLMAQNGLRKSQKLMNQSLTRLSTGLRINSAKDDAVNLSRSELLRTQVRAIDQALANITNAKSTLGVADGTLAELTEVAQQIYSLAVEAADDTLSSTDRTAVRSSLSTLTQEYNRLALTTFNGTYLLDGSFIDKGIQVGVKEGEFINVSVSDARTAAMGKVAIMTAQITTFAFTGESTSGLNLADPSGITIAGKLVSSAAFSADGVSNVDTDESSIAYVNAINSYTSQSGVTAQVLANVVTFTYTSTSSLDATMGLIINGITIKSSTTVYTSSDADVASVVSLINAKSSSTGVTATQDSSNDRVVLTASDGRNIDIRVTANSSSATVTSSNVFGFTGGSQYRTAVYRGGFKLISDAAFTVSGATAEFVLADATYNINESTNFGTIDFASAENAGTAMTIVEKTITNLQTIRASVGSALSRLDIAETELSSRQENFSSADSNIRDADVAAETANYTRASIQQQIGATVLAQANSMPEIALILLRGI